MTKEEHNILKQIQIDQKRTINQLSKHQEQLIRGQAKLITKYNKLEKGQEELNGRIINLEEGQKRLEKGQEKLEERVSNLEEGQKELKQEQKEIIIELKRLNDVVTIIEEDHGKKLDSIYEILTGENSSINNNSKNNVTTFKLLKGNKKDDNKTN